MNVEHKTDSTGQAITLLLDYIDRHHNRIDNPLLGVTTKPARADLARILKERAADKEIPYGL